MMEAIIREGARFSRAIEEDGRRIIAGYASVEIKDDYGTIITREALAEALPVYMKNPVLRYQHQPDPIGRVLTAYKTKDGAVLRTEVNDRGLFIVAEIINDPAATRANEVWALIRGGIITGFSVGGQMLETTQRSEATYITKIKLFEISVVDLPANEESHFKIYRNAEGEEPEETELGERIKDWLERKSYPWDQCVRDMKKQGHSQESAERICAAIKNRTVRHFLEYGLARTYQEAFERLVEKMEEDKIFSYVITRLWEAERRNIDIGETHIVEQGEVNMSEEDVKNEAPVERQEPAGNPPTEGGQKASPVEERVSALEASVSELSTTLSQVVQKLADIEAMLKTEETTENPPEGTEVTAGVLTERKGEVKDEEVLEPEKMERSKRIELLAEYEKERRY